MNDETLIRLHRRLGSQPQTAQRVQDADLGEALQRGSWPEHDDSALDRLAASTAHADVLRVVRSLREDAEALSRDLSALRTPGSRVAPRRPLRWIAMAAALGAAAVLVSSLPERGEPSLAQDAVVAPQDELLPQDVILSASFESAQADGEFADDIFRGDFDS